MSELETVTGQQTAWTILRKLGEGDAGEVYLVAPMGGGAEAILKRPRMSAFTGDIFRQSVQIRSEANIIAALCTAQGFDARIKVHIPHLLDQSKPGSEFAGHNFIVIEKAAGPDLSFLARVAQMGLAKSEDVVSGFGLEDRVLIDAIARTGKIPTRLLIDILYRITLYLDFIHTLKTQPDGVKTPSGILWNDIKPDHLFWDTRQSTLSIIDWGNAHFLANDLTTSNRQFSWVDDFQQLFEEMGRFLSVLAPELKERLGWPTQSAGENITPHTIEAIKSRLAAALQEESQAMAAVRANEEALLHSDGIGEIPLADIQTIQSQILEYGVTPDFDQTLQYAENFAARLTMEDRLDNVRKLCAWAGSLPGSDSRHWKMVDFLARIPGRSEGAQRILFLEAIQNAIARQWANALWSVATAIQDFPEPDWWHDLAAMITRLSLNPSEQNIRPLVSVKRVKFTVQAIGQDLELRPDADVTAGEVSDTKTTLEHVQKLKNHLEEVIANWIQLDPSPPDCSLEYKNIDPILAEAVEMIPEQHRTILASLDDPKAQVQLIMNEWENKNFLEAAKGLRRLLLLDPDRRRVLRSEKSIFSTPDWLKKVQSGPQPEENFLEWITAIELQGRELRNLVGPSTWLDAILDSCKQMRLGVWPSDVLKSGSDQGLLRPEIAQEMPWLTRFDRRERMIALLPNNLDLIEPTSSIILPEIHGVFEDQLGPTAGLSLIEPLDAWMPEARGSSARVVSGSLLFPDSSRMLAAIKLMRMDQIRYALPLFREEVTILSRLRNLPGIAHLVECGFIRLNEGSQYPFTTTNPTPPPEGRVIRIGPDATAVFLEQIEDQIEQDWTPYLAIEQQNVRDNLLFLCDAGITRGQYQPTVTLLQMAIQICDILQLAHDRNIVYRDHKILHYYWQAANNGIYIIDWNVARYHPDGLTQAEIEMDIVQFGARGLHHILTGRAAPGALPLGPTRPEEIEQAAHTYKTQWTYDDQRLSSWLRSILVRVLAGEYTRVSILQDDLKKSLIYSPAPA